MGWRRAKEGQKSQFKSASVSSERTKTMEDYWILDSEDDVNAFLGAVVSAGSIVYERYSDNKRCVFKIDSNEISRQVPRPDGSIYVTVTSKRTWLKLTEEQRNQASLPPWALPPYDYTTSNSTTEETSSSFFPGVGDLFCPSGSSSSFPFVNSAGVMLEGTHSRDTSIVSFSYNLSTSAFNSLVSLRAKNKTNYREVMICGTMYPPRTVKVNNYSASLQSTNESDSHGNETTYNYFKVSVEIESDGRTFDRKYLNVGTHVATPFGLSRLWTWTNPSTGGTVFGSRYEYLQSGSSDGEAVSENMFLNEYGTGVSGFDSNGRQYPTYRIGTMLEPVDFRQFGFPTASPNRWN